jgi:CRISPR-associated endonuclease/helicase Cas3
LTIDAVGLTSYTGLAEVDVSYGDLFRRLSGNLPFPWQSRLSDGPWPELLDVPTGLGKTAAVVIAWLHRRLSGDPNTGRRLVYCLPMRSLVRQVEKSAVEWCSRAAALFEQTGRPAPTVRALMGGEAPDDWEEAPEAEAILVGTQDMLLSRALCRGYAMNRYRWPVPFGLLGNDCFWVLDETQLMGVGVETATQLQALREKLGCLGPSHTLYMSATLDPRRLDTVDRIRPIGQTGIAGLTEEDLAVSVVQERMQAKKSLLRLEDLVGSSETPDYEERFAAELLRLHSERGGLTLGIVNRVDRAQGVYKELQAAGAEEGRLTLIHSRFRSGDRAAAESLLWAEGDRIVIATQAVEAGVDVSARTLVTELAPWSSLVQRFGRLNRYGEQEDARAVWVDIDTGVPKSSFELPYDSTELDEARAILSGLHDVGPARLRKVEYQSPVVVRPVLRRRDLLDLFDTTPDLLGFDVDVSPYVRDGDDMDVSFYWREFSDVVPAQDEPLSGRQEMCRAGIGPARRFLGSLKKLRQRQTDKRVPNSLRLRAFRYDPLGGRFVAAENPRPGETLLLHADAGGYAQDLGFTGVPGEPVQPVPPEDPEDRVSMDGDTESSLDRWVELPDHLRHVRLEATEIAAALLLPDVWRDAVATAAAWHDLGKAHAEFQRRLVEPVADDPLAAAPREALWAKSNHRRRTRTDRPGFRHELASALAWLQLADGTRDGQFRDLVAYLIAAHHGKVRLSIRSLPTEKAPADPETPFARGVWDGDPLPPVLMPDGRAAGPVDLDLSPVALGEGSWLERTLALRDAAELGPFRLGILEAVVRAADWRASGKESVDAYA